MGDDQELLKEMFFYDPHEGDGVPIEEVIKYLLFVSHRNAYLFIKRYGLDGYGKRTYKQLSLEDGTNSANVRGRISHVHCCLRGIIDFIRNGNKPSLNYIEFDFGGSYPLEYIRNKGAMINLSCSTCGELIQISDVKKSIYRREKLADRMRYFCNRKCSLKYVMPVIREYHAYYSRAERALDDAWERREP